MMLLEEFTGEEQRSYNLQTGAAARSRRPHDLKKYFLHRGSCKTDDEEHKLWQKSQCGRLALVVLVVSH
jgi:hypothetical protein